MPVNNQNKLLFLEQLGKTLNKSPDVLRDLLQKHATILGLKKKKNLVVDDENLVLNIKAIVEAKERGIADNDIPKALLLWNRIRRYGDFNIHAYGSLLMELKDYLSHTTQSKENSASIQDESPFFFEHINLRATPQILDFAGVKELVKTRGIYNKILNETGENLIHLFRVFKLEGHKVVMDYSTGLMWQQSGSDHPCTLKKAKHYIDDLNSMKCAGFANWRLPTCDELACLTQRQQNTHELYIDDIFAPEQWHIWSSDHLKILPRAWVAYFNDATIKISLNKKSYVRGVRTALISP
ncbi:DUF1566 domain-containing protein [candidate division KSB1 bacterium]|nr:DUF1566 domain-containing protein [candidate division KSB1 bacterium]